MAKFLGFKIERASGNLDATPQRNYIEKEVDDGALAIQAGGIYGQYYDISQGAENATNDSQLINRYRQIASDGDCESAIDEVVGEMISFEQTKDIVNLNLDKAENLSTGLKEKLESEFKNIIKLISFNYNAYDIARQWYVDGRLYYQKVIDEKNIKKGIVSAVLIDPRKIKKVKESVLDKDDKGNTIVKGYKKYFLYNPEGSIESDNKQKMIPLTEDSITYVTSGLRSIDNKLVLSHLHKAIKPLNQLKMLEDSIVVYRIVRAPERRIFYVDIGNLPKMKAEQYLQQLMNQYKTKLVYDSNTGEMKDQKRHMSMTEDYWMPRREGGRGTEVQTLQGGQNLGEMEDVQYFKQKLYKALKVPISRLESDTPFASRTTEVTREEIKFNKFISRLRLRFTHLFDDLLKTQLVLKGIISLEDWGKIRNDISYRFNTDSVFHEAKRMEIFRERFSMLRDASEYMGNFISKEWVWKNILQMDDLEISEMKKQIEKEKKDGEYGEDEDGDGNMFNSFDVSKDAELKKLEPLDEYTIEEKESNLRLLNNLNEFLENE